MVMYQSGRTWRCVAGRRRRRRQRQVWDENAFSLALILFLGCSRTVSWHIIALLMTSIKSIIWQRSSCWLAEHAALPALPSSDSAVAHPTLHDDRSEPLTQLIYKTPASLRKRKKLGWETRALLIKKKEKKGKALDTGTRKTLTAAAVKANPSTISSYFHAWQQSYII